MIAALLSLASVVSPSVGAASTTVTGCELVRTDVRAVRPLYGAAAASDGEAAYFAGGDTPYGLSKDIWRYQPGARGVRELKVGITPRRYAGAAFYEGRLFVIGGSDGRRAFATVEAVDVTRESLERLPELKTPRAFPGVAVHEGALWVAGGEHAGRAQASVEIYDAASNAWRAGPPLSVARTTRLVVMDGALWALPGYDGKDAVAVLEKLEGGRWVQKDGALALSAFSAAPVEGGALLFGDYRDLTGTWFLSKDGALKKTLTAQVARRHAAAASVGGQVIVFGGNRTSKNASSVGVLEAFEARCAPVTDGESCDALRARGDDALKAGRTSEARTLLDKADARCGVGQFVRLALATQLGREGRVLERAQVLRDELARPAAHPAALDMALRLPKEDPALDALLRPLGRTKETAISVGKVKGQRAWVERFGCGGGEKPTALKQALTRDHLDRWTFTCAGGASAELWFDFETRPVAAWAERSTLGPAE